MRRMNVWNVVREAVSVDDEYGSGFIDFSFKPQADIWYRARVNNMQWWPDMDVAVIDFMFTKKEIEDATSGGGAVGYQQVTGDKGTQCVFNIWLSDDGLVYGEIYRIENDEHVAVIGARGIIYSM